MRPGLGTRRDANSLFLGDSFGKKMDEIADEALFSGTQSVAYSAIEAAQTTLPQCYYAGADYLLIRPQMSEPAAFLFGHGDNNGNVNAALNTFDFNYQSSPRVFLGYRSPTSGSGIQFTYWHFQENASSNFNATTQNSGFIPDVNFIWFLIGQGNNNTITARTLATRSMLRCTCGSTRSTSICTSRWLWAMAAGC